MDTPYSSLGIHCPRHTITRMYYRAPENGGATRICRCKPLTLATFHCQRNDVNATEMSVTNELTIALTRPRIIAEHHRATGDRSVDANSIAVSGLSS